MKSPPSGCPSENLESERLCCAQTPRRGSTHCPSRIEGAAMGKDRHEASKRGQGKKVGGKRRYAGPPVDQPWAWFTREMINSPAFRAVPPSAFQVLFRLLEEHMAQGGTRNGDLIVTHDQFEESGVRKASVSAWIKALEFLGFIHVDRGRSYRGDSEPNRYRLTWLGDLHDAPPTNNWKGISEPQIQVWQKSKKQKSAETRKKAFSRKAVAMGRNVVPLCAA
jgi:hypothetical protein